MFIDKTLRVKARGFTLIELIIVIIIIGILSTLALPAFSTTKQKALDKEAIANLKLIQAAEKIYKMETSAYYPASGSNSNTTEINNNLKLSLSDRNWEYAVYDSGCGEAVLKPTATSGKKWSLGVSSVEEPSNTTGC